MSLFDQPAADFMSAPVAAIHPESSLAEAERRLAEGGHSCLAVVGDDGMLCGVLSRTDILRIGRLRASMAEEPRLLAMPHQTVRMKMTRDVVTADPTTPLRAAAAAMVQRSIHRVFVIADGRPAGTLSSRDLMQAIVKARFSEPISRWMSSPVVTVDATDSIAAATDLLHRSHVRGVVVEDQGWPVGIFTQTEALASASLDSSTPVEEVMSCALLCLPPNLPLFRAAAFALKTQARRVLAVASREIQGILSGLDMAHIVANR